MGCVKKVVTDLAVLEIKTGAFHLLERAPGVSVEEIQAKTEGTLIVNGIISRNVLFKFLETLEVKYITAIRAGC